MSTPIRIHLLGVEPDWPSNMLDSLARHPDLLVTGSSAMDPAAAPKCRRTCTQVALIAAGGASRSALRLVAGLRGGRPRVECIALVDEFDGTEGVIPLLAAGARAILLRTTSPDEIYRAARAVVAGGCVLGSAATTLILDAASRAQQGFLGVPLEPLDLEIISILATGVTGHQAARRLGVDRATVRARLRVAKRALGTRSNEGVVAAAMRRGLVG